MRRYIYRAGVEGGKWKNGFAQLHNMRVVDFRLVGLIVWCGHDDGSTITSIMLHGHHFADYSCQTKTSFLVLRAILHCLNISPLKLSRGFFG